MRGCARRSDRTLELQAELHLGLMALEIGEIERAGSIRGTAGDLRAPRRNHPRALREPRIEGRAEEQRLAGESFERETLVGAQITGLAADEDARRDLHHQAGSGAEHRLARPGTAETRARRLRLVG